MRGRGKHFLGTVVDEKKCTQQGSLYPHAPPTREERVASGTRSNEKEENPLYWGERNKQKG